jgi:endonuclease/exonuclease/phosphatase family metal-dependent hydrolase
MARKAKGKQPALPVGTIAVLIIVALFLLWHFTQNQPAVVTGKPGDYVFVFWNAENLFDDSDDGRGKIDEAWDDWFAQNPADLQLKLDRMTEVLLPLNAGKGPDILALVEVENRRAAELLKEALNKKIDDPALHYKEVLMEEVRVGRHIAPAIITRLPVVRDRTKQIGPKSQRTLSGRVTLNGKELIIIASHWTSRLDGGADRRAVYADDIYGEFKAMYLNNPSVDLLVCGDFNDNPDDISVTQHLRATGDIDLVKQGGQWPMLFNLMAGKDRSTYGTLYYSGWHIFDQIAVSPGMLDSQGWSCDPKSATTLRSVAGPSGQIVSLVDRQGRNPRPWAFGRRTDTSPRGYSDHFPVSVILTLHGEAEGAGK